MSRIRTLRLMLGLCAAAWAMFVVTIVGLISLRLVAHPQRHVNPARATTYPTPYARAYGPRAVTTRRVCCCPPPPCCPRGTVAYVPYAVRYVPPPAPYTPDPPLPVWPFVLAGLLGVSALGASLATNRWLAPIQP